ncbi:MAG TPA: hypothetical protein VG146_01915 [Verrucomicrobiae bacterium]|nr:hypothetical protein [Verrucomicrobiae bacterium]
MLTPKQLKLAQKSAAEQRQVIKELNALATDIERSEKTVTQLRGELEALNVKFQGPRTTRDDIGYLSGLLDCAKKKLAWEKQMASLQKRAPAILERVSKVIDDALAPPPDEVRAELLRGLQAIQAAMERLQNLKPA